MARQPSNRTLELLFGKETVHTLAQANLLIVGVGGIGCELLKNLSKSGIRKFTILDLDHIEETNLNRQFYFRRADVGKSKAETGKKRILQIDPHLEVTDICDNIFDAKYDVAFFAQFDVVISALDSQKAREYLCSMCMKAGKPMIDAGTEGYAGQARSVVRFLTDCHNCEPSRQEQTFAVCTIRTRPEKPIHCIAFAKLFYECFFGDNAYFGDELKREDYLGQGLSEEDVRNAAEAVFDYTFYKKIVELQREETDPDLKRIRPLLYKNALNSFQIVSNPEASTFSASEHSAQQKSMYEEEKLWSLSMLAQRFMEAFCSIIKNQRSQIGQLKFQKDDEDCMMLVYCVSQLRTYNFINNLSKTNKHKYMTYFQVKDMAGKIIAAIASTNSIAAGLQIQDSIKMLQGHYDSLMYTTFYHTSGEKLCGMGLGTPRLSCSVCSLANIYLWMRCDFSAVTFGDLSDHLKGYLSYDRDMMIKTNEGSTVRVLSNKPNHPNRKKLIASMPAVISDRQSVEICYQPSDSRTAVTVNLFLQNKPGLHGFELVSKEDINQIKQNLLKHKRQLFEQQVYQVKKYEFMDFGYK